MRTFFVIALFIATLHAQASDAVMRLRAEWHAGNQTTTKHGTCVAIESASTAAAPVLTALHVIRDGKRAPDSVLVEHPDHGWIACRVVKVDEKEDLALLESSLSFKERLRLLPPIPLTVRASTEGQAVNSESADLVKATTRCETRHGMSGGALIYADTYLAGLILAGTGNGKGVLRGDEAVIVAAPVIRSFLGNTP